MIQDKPAFHKDDIEQFCSRKQATTRTAKFQILFESLKVPSDRTTCFEAQAELVRSKSVNTEVICSLRCCEHNSEQMKLTHIAHET